MSAPQPGHKDLTGRTSFVIALGALVSVSAISMDVMLPAVPVFATALATDANTAQLAITLYFAGFALGQIPAGLTTDRIGRRPVAFFGLVVFVAGGVVAALAGDIRVLLMARFVQGLGASTTPVVARAIVRDVATGAEAGKLMSLMVSIITLAPLLAPSVGSALLAVSSWRSPFAFGAATGVIALWLMWRYVPETGVRANGAAGVERRIGVSIRGFFASSQCRVGVALASLGSGGYMAVLTSSSAILADVYSVPATWFGPVFAIAASAVTAGALLSRHLLGRLGMTAVIRAGARIMAVAAVVLGAVTVTGEVPLWAFWGAVMVFMLGGGMMLPNATTLALEGLPRAAGFGASILGTIQLSAGTLSSAIAAAVYSEAVVSLTAIMTVCAGACAGLGLVAYRTGWMEAPDT